jgi:hypothetical protein
MITERREYHEMTEEGEVYWGVQIYGSSHLGVFGPFESKEEAHAYIYSERFADFDHSPENCGILRFWGTSPVHVACDSLEWTRPDMPQFRDPDTGRPKSADL